MKREVSFKIKKKKRHYGIFAAKFRHIYSESKKEGLQKRFAGAINNYGSDGDAGKVMK